MNLAIDIGNTRIKLGIFDNKHLIFFKALDDVEQFIQNDELVSYFPKIKKIITSNVSNKNIQNYLQKHFSTESIYSTSSKLKRPVQIDYETHQTLGQDRIAAVIAAVAEFSNNPILIIDFGTCIKYNVIVNNVFIGGAISPGLQMRYNVLHQFTGKLPLLKFSKLSALPEIIAKNSSDNIHSGVIYGTIYEVKSFINTIQKLYSEHFTIILTGGDATFFEKVLDLKVFLRPYLILTGLNELLEFQK